MMRKSRKNLMKTIFIIICLVLIFLMINLYMNSRNRIKEEKIKRIHASVELIKKLESKDVMEIENKINSADKINEEKDNELKYNELKDKDLKKMFENYVVMGDSRSESLIGYNILNKSSVVAYKGRNTHTARKDINVSVNLYPRKVFMTYGMNDIEYFAGNADKFVQSYEKIIKDLKLKSPKSKIYVCDILPVQQKVIDKKSIYRKSGEFNNALKEMCNRLDLTFIETKDILIKNPKFYEPDGIHLKYDFYSSWLKELLDKSNS